MTNDNHAGPGDPAAESEPALAGYPPPAPYGDPAPQGPWVPPEQWGAYPPAPYPPAAGEPGPSGPTSYGQAPYGQAPYGQAPYGQAHYDQAPYGQAPHGQQFPGQAPAPLPYGAAVWPATKPSPLPDGPREYQQMLRGPRYRWWRPLLAAALAFLIVVPLMILAVVPVLLAAVAAGVPDALRWTFGEISRTDNLGPAGFLYLNLSLIALIPAAGLSIWIVHRIRPRYLASVRGRIRWRWLLRCIVIVVPVFAVYLGIGALTEPAASPRPAQWGLLLVIVLVLTPLQAAGEEYLFRGWIMQNVGSWFRNPVVGLVVSLALSVGFFSWAHGSPDIWVLGSLGIFALTAGLATWRTGGLEAGIVIHAVNNVGVFITVILLGGWQDAFVGATTKGTPLDVAVTLVAHAVTLALILWQAKKIGLQRHYLPPAAPQIAPTDYPAAGYPAVGSPAQASRT